MYINYKLIIEQKKICQHVAQKDGGKKNKKEFLQSVKVKL